MAETFADIEIHFIHGDPLCFTMDSATDSFYRREDDGALVYTLTASDTAGEEIVIDPSQIRYRRTVTRQKPEDEAQP